ncbi:hypothetical protein BDZ91DRAFT_746219, partial [Kalaharituber pfeilii]
MSSGLTTSTPECPDDSSFGTVEHRKNKPTRNPPTSSTYTPRNYRHHKQNTYKSQQRPFREGKSLVMKDYPQGKAVAEWSENWGRITKEGYELLASYNWVERDGVPKIVVPGSPARWNPPTLPAWLTPDQGRSFIDQNSFRHPSCPFLPLFLSLWTLRPTYSLLPVSLITDRNTLRKLFRFVCADPNHVHDFKLYIQVVHNTVILNRWEPQTVHIARPGERSYGHGFHDAFSKYGKEVEGSKGHNRVARYRFSADAYLGRNSPYLKKTVDVGKVQEKREPERAPEKGGKAKLATPPSSAGVAVNYLDTAQPRPPPPLPTIVPIHRAGHLIPQSHILEIKTRSLLYCSAIDLTDQIPQMYFSHTTNLFVGYHQRGSFSRVDPDALDDDNFAGWEGKHQRELGRLRAFFGLILEKARGLKDGKGQIVYAGARARSLWGSCRRRLRRDGG